MLLIPGPTTGHRVYDALCECSHAFPHPPGRTFQRSPNSDRDPMTNRTRLLAASVLSSLCGLSLAACATEENPERHHGVSLALDGPGLREPKGVSGGISSPGKGGSPRHRGDYRGDGRHGGTTAHPARRRALAHGGTTAALAARPAVPLARRRHGGAAGGSAGTRRLSRHGGRAGTGAGPEPISTCPITDRQSGSK